MFETLVHVICGFACFSCVAFSLNALFFRRAPRVDRSDNFSGDLNDGVSVLIPVRNEADKIAATLDAVLANQGIAFEVVVLDDDSTDDTARIVQSYASNDDRVRIVSGESLPAGWCGKQFACHQLAKHARYEQLLFIDADVTLADDAIVRAEHYRRRLGVDLLSGFPRQRVETTGEAWLIPMMHIVLLTYLPFVLMRRTRMVGASAGCGQFMLVSRKAYEASGGHESIRDTLHDGVRLPRSLRSHKYSTDVFDGSDIAHCRMYHGWQETWAGLSKNAHEGIANRALIVPFTLLMSHGYVLPIVLASIATFQSTFGSLSGQVAFISWIAVAVSYVPRVVSAVRFDRAWSSVIWFPLCVVCFLTLQWHALYRHTKGIGSSWRGRVYPAKASPEPTATA